MENKKINQKVENTFKVLDAIEKVEVDHFFKHKVLQKLNAEKEVKKVVFSWFTPQLQLVTLCVVLLLNVSAIFYAFSSSETTVSSDIEIFAEEYSLQSSSSSILN
ncbi:hypothetical protein [Polaribacter marinus]|nr:hypothetical protein [Polaribacter marinus]